jgi:K+-transporting ATPase ATPase C chain
MRDFTSELRPAAIAIAAFTLLTGIVYPLAITAIAHVTFPHEAGGSISEHGSELVGQAMTDPKYFWGRPSATSDADGKPAPYNASSSAADNLGPESPDLAKVVAERVAALRAVDPGNSAPVPIDLVTASASGLDPDISPAAAYYQVDRVARARHLSPDAVRALVAAHVQDRLFGMFGDPHVNVLELDVALDDLARGGTIPP